MENNLSESEKSWKETIKFLLENQGTREELTHDSNNKKLFYTNFTPEFKEIYEYIKTYMTKQAEHLNPIIDKAYEFANEYCKKHKININELALQKNNRVITSDIHGDYFSMIVAFIFSGINFFKNCFFYFDLAHKRFFRSEEEYVQSIKEEIILDNCIHYIKFINTFIKYSEEFINILNQNENDPKSIEKLNNLINEESENKNHQFDIIKEIKENTVTIDNKKIHCGIKGATLTFIDNNKNKIIIDNNTGDLSLKIKAENFYKSSTIYIATNKGANSRLLQYKQELIYKILKDNLLNHFYLIPIPYINPNFKGKFINLGDLIYRKPKSKFHNGIIKNKSEIKFESIVCLVTYALLSQAKPNSIICLLGNHETTLKDNELLQNLIEFCIEKKALRTGYIEKAIKDGKKIYYSYSHAAIELRTLKNLFAILYLIFYIDIEIKRLRNTETQESDIEVFAKHIKEKWPRRFSELPEELQTKVINFFDKSNLKQLDIGFDDPDDPNYTKKSHQFDDFFVFINFFAKELYLLHQILKNAGFNDIDFVELRNALGDIIYNKFLSIISSVEKFSNFMLVSEKNFINAQKLCLSSQNTPILLDNIYQHVSNFFNYFTVIPKNSNGLLTNHNVLDDRYNETKRYYSWLYKPDAIFFKTESRIHLFISNIITNNFFIIDGFVSRDTNCQISKESQIIIDDSISQIIFNKEYLYTTYKDYDEIKKYFCEMKNFINFTNNKIDENLIKKSLTENNELEKTKIMLTQSKESWQTAINFINQKHNSETAKKESDLFEIIMNTRKNILNSLIDKIYANTYTEPNDLKENSYFPLITKLIKQNIISLNESLPTSHFNLQNNEFISEKKYRSLICEKICKSKNAILLIYIFLNKLENFMSIYPQPYVKSYYRSQPEIEANAKSIILSLNFSINKLSNKKFTIKEVKKGEKIRFSDENGNFISIGNADEYYQYIAINAFKTNFVYKYKATGTIKLNDYFTEERVDLDSYFQKIRDIALNWLNNFNLTIDAIKFYFEIPIPTIQSKEKFICFLKEPTNIAQQIEYEELSNKEFIEKFIETYEQKNKETLTCFMTLALTALSNPNIKFILSNYETTFCGNEYFAKIIDYCIEEKIFINGYVEEKTEGDKQIWHSYSHTIFTKKHLQKLFAILFVLIYIDKEIQRLNDCGKELSFCLENYLKAKWPIKLKELPKESQEKLLSFFDERNLQALNLNTWEDFLKIDWQKFYEILITAKFTDIEFFLLKIIVCDIFHNKYYSKANHIWKSLFSAIAGEMNWLYHEEYIPQNSNETFSIIQHLGQYYENLTQNLNCFNAELIQLQKTEYNFLDDEAEYNLVSSSDDEEIDKIREEDLATPIEIIPPLTSGDQSELSEP